MTTMVWTYVAYLVICVGITIWVAQTLRKQGRVVLTDGHEERRELSEAYSHLLVVGFYLMNLGMISFYLKLSSPAINAETAIELLSSKIGLILIVMGGVYFLIVAVLAKIRIAADAQRAQDQHRAAILEQRRTGASEPVFNPPRSDR